MKTQHKTIEELLLYLDNPLGCENDETIEEHLSECEQCVSDMGFIDNLRLGVKEFGKMAQEFVKNGTSRHLVNDEISGYIRETSNDDEKKGIVTHLAGCNTCMDDVVTARNLLSQVEKEPDLLKKSYLLAKFILMHPVRISLVEKEAKELIGNAARRGIALFEISRSFSFSFKGTDKNSEIDENVYRKMEISDFTIEIIQIDEIIPRIIISIVAKDEIKQANIKICAEEEISNVVSLDNRRAILVKENIKFTDVRYVKAEMVD